MADDFPIRGVDHVELFVGGARLASVFYEKAFGFSNTAYRGLETGSRDVVSYVMEQGDIRLVLTAPLGPDHPLAAHVHEHGDDVGVIAFDVPDPAEAFRVATARGARPAISPTEQKDARGVFRVSAIHLYGDTLLKFVDCRGYEGGFAPGFEPRDHHSGGHATGLQSIDHIVGNVELGAMERWSRFFADTMGFTELMHFDDRAISTKYSALMSKVMQDGTGRIKFPLNEPAHGLRKSQVEEYLDYHRGPGVQHIAFATDDIIQTVAALRRNGVEFIEVPGTYYEDIEKRVGPIAESIGALAELGVLIDRDEEGYLLQIFTEPVGDRPTLFFEIIERHGSKGFGEGNFKSLFEAIERDQARRGNLV